MLKVTVSHFDVAMGPRVRIQSILRFALSSGAAKALHVQLGPTRSDADFHVSVKPARVSIEYASLSSAAELKSPVTITGAPSGNFAM